MSEFLVSFLDQAEADDVPEPEAVSYRWTCPR